MSSRPTAWPNGKRIAVAVSVMFETWSEGKAPGYSVQATHLKAGAVDHAGKAWSTYGGLNGVWRVIRTLDRWQVPGTFFTNAQCGDMYPEAIRQIVRSGHDIAGHAVTQDKLLTYMEPEEELATIRLSLDMLEASSGKRPTGWLSPAVAFTPHTVGFLAQEGLKWHNDVTYVDLPHRIETSHGVIAGVPKSDFTDNRVLKSSTKDLYDVYTSTFDYLYEHEPMSMLVLTLHCHFGGRPMVISVFDQIMKHIASHDDVWFARLEELGDWGLQAGQQEHDYASRFF